MRVLKMMSWLLLLGRRLCLSHPFPHKTIFEGVQDSTNGGKSDMRCNNIHVTNGYAKQWFESEMNEDGFHMPSI
jgi:hypothetical protein